MKRRGKEREIKEIEENEEGVGSGERDKKWGNKGLRKRERNGLMERE